MDHITAELLPSVGESARRVIRDAKAAGVYVFGGGLDETVAPVIISGSGAVTPGAYPQTRLLNGGFCVLKVETRGEAEAWASRLAAACQCGQELRQFMFDPES